MAENDHAILVGISRYADESLGTLNGPVPDVRLIYDWLVSPRGGGLSEKHIDRIVSDEALQAPGNGQDMPPIFQDFFNTFLRLVRKPDKSGGYIRREGSRLYLYFSGHGFCEKHKREAHAALYTANADRDVTWNIYGTYFAQWTRDQGLFDEIVLIMDCCRDAELSRQPMVPPLRKPTDIGVARDVKLFELYAAPRGGKAQERPIASRKNEVHGLLTHAFLDALEHAAPGHSKVSTSAIKGYLEERWSDLCGEEQADKPEIIVPSNGEMSFNRPWASDLPQRFKLTTLQAGNSFEVIGTNFSKVACVSIEVGRARIERMGGGITVQAIDNGILVVPLPAGLYRAEAWTPKGMLKQDFQAGGNDVEL